MDGLCGGITIERDICPTLITKTMRSSTTTSESCLGLPDSSGTSTSCAGSPSTRLSWYSTPARAFAWKSSGGLVSGGSPSTTQTTTNYWLVSHGEGGLETCVGLLSTVFWMTKENSSSASSTPKSKAPPATNVTCWASTTEAAPEGTSSLKAGVTEYVYFIDNYVGGGKTLPTFLERSSYGHR